MVYFAVLLLLLLGVSSWNVDSGQMEDKNWPYEKTVEKEDVIVQPFGETVLYEFAKSSYQFKYTLNFEDSNYVFINDYYPIKNLTDDSISQSKFNDFVLDEENMKAGSTVRIKLIPNYFLKTIMDVEKQKSENCYRKQLNVEYFPDYCCDKKDIKGVTDQPGGESIYELAKCTLQYSEKYSLVLNSSSYSSEKAIKFNSISYEDQQYNLFDLSALVLQSFSVKKTTRFNDYINYVLVMENWSNETLLVKELEIIENSDEPFNFTYFFFSNFVFSVQGLALFIFVWLPIICCCCGGCFFCVNCCICCLPEKKKKEEVENVDSSFAIKKENQNESIIREQVQTIKNIQHSYYSLYGTFRKNKKETTIELIGNYIKYIVNRQTILETSYLISNKFIEIFGKNKKIKEKKNFKKVKGCFNMIEDEETKEMKFLFSKKITFFIISLVICFFSEILLESYVVNSVILPTSCHISTLAFEEQNDHVYNEEKLVIGSKDDDFSVIFEPKEAFLFEGELNPAMNMYGIPFDSNYETVLYSPFSFFVCRINETEHDVEDSRSICNETHFSSGNNLKMWMENPDVACNQVVEFLEYWFYKIIATILSFIVMFFPLAAFEASFYWSGGPFFCGALFPCLMSKKKSEIKHYKRKNCCATLVFFLSLIALLIAILLTVFYLVFYPIDNWYDYFASFVTTLLIEMGYELLQYSSQYFCCCKWATVKKRIKKTKVKDVKVVKTEETVNKEDLDETELKSINELKTEKAEKPKETKIEQPISSNLKDD